MIDVTGIETGVIVAAIVGAGSAAWVFLDKRGQAFWKSLGTVETLTAGPPSRVVGLRAVAVVALFAAVVGVASAIAAVVSSEQHIVSTPGLVLNSSSGKVSYVSVRFGQLGSSKDGHDPGQPFVQLPQPGTQTFTSVAEFPICEITEIRVVNAAGTCRLEQNAGQWGVMVTGEFACGVTCFSQSLK